MHFNIDKKYMSLEKMYYGYILDAFWNRQKYCRGTNHRFLSKCVFLSVSSSFDMDMDFKIWFVNMDMYVKVNIHFNMYIDPSAESKTRVSNLDMALLYVLWIMLSTYIAFFL